jgi:hypothetical protein
MARCFFFDRDGGPPGFGRTIDKELLMPPPAMTSPS